MVSTDQFAIVDGSLWVEYTLGARILWMETISIGVRHEFWLTGNLGGDRIHVVVPGIPTLLPVYDSLRTVVDLCDSPQY